MDEHLFLYIAENYVTMNRTREIEKDTPLDARKVNFLIFM